MNESEIQHFTKSDTLKTKGIAICLLLFHHAFRTVNHIANANVVIPDFLTAETIASIAYDFRICVWIFAFLSAYGLGKKYLENKRDMSPTLFIYYQYWGLMKPYWFIYILVFILSFFIFTDPLTIYKGNYLHILLDFLGLSDLFTAPMLTSVWWYMSFAQILVLLIPALVLFVDKFGVLSLFIAHFGLLSFGSGFHSDYGGYYSIYLYTVLMAVLCAKYSIFEKLCKRNLLLSILGFVLLPIIFFGCAHLKVYFSGTVISSISTVFSGISAIALCLFVMRYTQVPVVKQVLSFLGKHSGNIFMIHSLILSYYPKIIFVSRSILISFLTLLVISLMCSIVIELIKKVLHYDTFITKISQTFLRKTMTLA